jgi:ubiquinone/menaquinone biosynthesis C-methylase UbiE
LRRAASWRGPANATSKRDFEHLLKLIRPSKSKDIFFDLGCGYGNLCLWISPKVMLAVGLENHYDRYKRAKIRIERAGLKNVHIRYANFAYSSFKNATIIYSIVDTGLDVMAKINRESKAGTRFIQYGRPIYPIKGRQLFRHYFIMRTPFKRVKDEKEYARILLRRKTAKVSDLRRRLGTQDYNYLDEEIRRSGPEWERLFVK